MGRLTGEKAGLEREVAKLRDQVTLSSSYFTTVRVENFEVFLISRFSWVTDDTKIIHVEGGITTCEIFNKTKS